MHAARVRVEVPRHIGRRLGRHRSEFLGLSYERDGLIARGRLAHMREAASLEVCLYQADSPNGR